MIKTSVAFSSFLCLSLPLAFGGSAQPPEGFAALFNGEDLAGWRIPEGDSGHWRVIDGVIDYDAQSEAPGDKSLWTEAEYGDFVLMLEWRIKETPFVNPNIFLIKPDGSHKKDAQGEDIRIHLADADSGIFMRGTPKSQINIWAWPIGSGEVYGYRTDGKMPPDVRAGVTPSRAADHDIGEWNAFVITLQGELLTVELNGFTVIEDARLPNLPQRGPVALQHHGARDEQGNWTSSPSLVQFRNIFIKEL